MKNIDLYKKIEAAKINLKAGNPLEAYKIFQELLKTNNDSLELLYEYGLFCKNLKNYNLAKRVFLTLIRKFPSSINSYILLAEMLRMENKFNDAEKVLHKALKINPNHNGINEYLGELYLSTNRPEKAKERLAVLQNCNCEEYEELKVIIDGTKQSMY